MAIDPHPSASTDRTSGPVLEYFDWTTNESICAAVVEAVASVTGESPTDLPPLYESIDTDALQALLTGGPGTSGSGQVGVTFPYDDYQIVVSSSGEGQVCPQDPDSIV